MAQGVIDQATVEVLGKFNSSIIFSEQVSAEVLGKSTQFTKANADYLVVEVLGKFNFSTGVVAADLIGGEVLGESTQYHKGNVDQVSAEVIGQWSGF